MNSTTEEWIDQTYFDAVELVIKKQSVSISMIQRFFKLGYNHAARICERMQVEKVISDFGVNGVRTVLLTEKV